MTKAKQRDALAAAEQRFADLEAEQAGLDQVVTTARAKGDVETWMRCLNRGEALPGELDEARAEMLRLQLAAAWEDAERLLAAEVEPAAREEAASKAWRDACAPAFRVSSHIAAAEYRLAVARAAEAMQAARSEHAAARDATDLALLCVEELEDDLRDLTGEEPIPEDAEGLRARPRPLLHSSVMLDAPDNAEVAEAAAANAARHGLATQIPTAVAFVPAGTVPPRWAAHRLDPSIFEPPLPPGVPTPAEAEAAERERARMEKWAEQVNAANAVGFTGMTTNMRLDRDSAPVRRLDWI